MLGLFLLATMTRVADAHTLAADDSLPAQLVHQVMGLHHLPITAMLLVGVIVVSGIWHKNSRATVRDRK
jgi:hypothetical protein